VSELGALAPILARKREEAESLRGSAAGLWARAAEMPPGRGFTAALHGGALIAEMKRRSPSGGSLRPALDPDALARAYTAAGAAAISVLTDAADFGGSLADLAAVREATGLPLLRKDFVVDPVQVVEARVAGADAVLLIVAALPGGLLDACMDAAARAGVDVLAEVHDQAQTERALASGAGCIGVNNRDLRTLRTDPGTFARLRPLIRGGTLCVAESGMRDAADVTRLVAAGADAVLVGETLMRASDPAAACAALASAGRAAAAGRTGVVR
jgi:indole-3-glycerol phosphate synthase